MNDQTCVYLLNEALPVEKHLDRQPIFTIVGDDPAFDQWWARYKFFAEAWYAKLEEHSAFARKLRSSSDDHEVTTDMVRCMLAYLRQEKYDCETEEQDFMFKTLMNDEIILIKRDGTQFEKIKANIQKGNIRPDPDRTEIIYDEGDTIVRHISDNHQEVYTIVAVTYNRPPRYSMIPDHYHLEVIKASAVATSMAGIYIGKAENVVVNQANDVKEGDVNNVVQSK